VNSVQLQACRHSGFILGAALQAWRQSGLPIPLPQQPTEHIPSAERVGIYLGAGEGPLDFDNFINALTNGWKIEDKNIDWRKWAETAFSRMEAMRELGQEPNMPSAHLAQLFQVRGPCMSCLTACAASTQAIGEATELIRCGQTDMMIAGGCHSMIHVLGITGFNRLTALSIRNDNPQASSRPFDRDRVDRVINQE